MRIRSLREQQGDSVGHRQPVSVSLISVWFLLVLVAGPLPLLSGVSTAAAELLENVAVNYAHNWVGGHTDPSAEVTVTVNDEYGGPKGATTVTAEPDGNFFVDCPRYDPNPCPDINPGDTVIVDVPGLQHLIDPVRSIEGLFDEVENTVSGTLDTDGLTPPVPVRCQVWSAPGPPSIDTSADPDEGTFTCDFDDVGWDLQRGDMVAMMYFEPDGDGVINIGIWPWMRVNSTQDWVGGNFAAGHSVAITVTNSVGDPKASAQTDTDWGAGWGEDGFQTEPDQWSPGLPDIVPGDSVYFEVAATGAITFTVDVGDIDASVDVDDNTVTGTVDADFTDPLRVECHPWGAPIPTPIKTDMVEPDGLEEFTCDWNGEWDIQPGQDIAVMYIEPRDNRVIEVFRQSAPHLVVGKWAHGAPAAGGNFVFTIDYHNDGDAPAENVTITDTMDIVIEGTPVPGGMVYLSDTSGLPHTGSGNGPIVWDVGTLDPGQGGAFELYVAVTPSVGEIIRNSALIETTSDDTGPPEEKTAWWEGPVLDNDTHLNVNKYSWVPEPAPGQPIIFNIGVCNPGQTGSTQLTLTDALGDGLTLDIWWSEHPGWSEDSSGEGGFTLTTPSIPGTECREVLVRAHVDSVTEGTPLSNTATIIAANDMETGDNESTWSGIAGEAHLNLWIIKRLNRGVLAPGGELFYNISYGNGGNQAAGPVRFVETLPAGTSFLSAWHSGPLGNFNFVPITVEPDHVVWELTQVPGGATGNIEVHLAVDADAIPGSELINEIEICGPPAEPPELCDPIPGEDTYDDNSSVWSEVLYPSGPNLRITKRSAWANGITLRYILRFQNIGKQMISDVSILDTLPAHTFWDTWWDMEFDPGRLVGPPVLDAGVLTWNLSELHPGENGRVRFTAVLDGSQQPLQWIENNAEITVPVGDTNPDDNFDTTMDLWGNQCGGDDVILFEETYGDAFWCLAPGSITASSVTVTGTGQVILRSPLVVCGNGLVVESGGTLTVGAP